MAILGNCLGVFRILYLSNWDIDSVWCLHAHCIVCDCVCVRVYVCSQCYCWPKAVSVHKLSVLLLAHFSVTVRVLALLFFLYLCSYIYVLQLEKQHIKQYLFIIFSAAGNLGCLPQAKPAAVELRYLTFT